MFSVANAGWVFPVAKLLRTFMQERVACSSVQAELSAVYVYAGISRIPRLNVWAELSAVDVHKQSFKIHT